MAARAGQYRHPVAYQTVATSPDATYGGPEEATTALGTRRTRIRPLSGAEKFAAQQHYGEVSHEFAIRYDSTMAALTTEHQATWDGRTFDIRSVTETGEQGREIVMVVTEKR